MPGPFDQQYADIRKTITYYAQKYGIDPNIAIWQLWTENKFKSNGCSSAGACGIAQFIPSTARRFGVNVNDVNSSLNGYGQYMAYLRNFFHGDMTKAVAAYNAGEGNIAAGRYPAETRDYLQKIYAGINGGSGAVTVGNRSVPNATSTPTFDFSQYLGVSILGEKNRYLLAFAILVVIFIFAFN